MKSKISEVFLTACKEKAYKNTSCDSGFNKKLQQQLGNLIGTSFV